MAAGAGYGHPRPREQARLTVYSVAHILLLESTISLGSRWHRSSMMSFSARDHHASDVSLPVTTQPRSIQVAQHLRRGSKVVVACSALKKAYRDVLVTDGVSGDACNLLFVRLQRSRPLRALLRAMSCAMVVGFLHPVAV